MPLAAPPQRRHRSGCPSHAPCLHVVLAKHAVACGIRLLNGFHRLGLADRHEPRQAVGTPRPRRRRLQPRRHLRTVGSIRWEGVERRRAGKAGSGALCRRAAPAPAHLVQRRGHLAAHCSRCRRPALRSARYRQQSPGTSGAGEHTTLWAAAGVARGLDGIAQTGRIAVTGDSAARGAKCCYGGDGGGGRRGSAGRAMHVLCHIGRSSLLGSQRSL